MIKIDAQCVDECQKIMEDTELSKSIAFISSAFSILSKTIKKLETRGLKLSVALNEISEVEKALDGLYKKASAANCRMLFKRVASGLQTMKMISCVLQESLSVIDFKLLNRLKLR